MQTWIGCAVQAGCPAYGELSSLRFCSIPKFMAGYVQLLSHRATGENCPQKTKPPSPCRAPPTASEQCCHIGLREDDFGLGTFLPGNEGMCGVGVMSQPVFALVRCLSMQLLSPARDCENTANQSQIIKAKSATGCI